MTKINCIVASIMMCVMIYVGFADDGYLNKLALIVAGVYLCMIGLSAWMEWKGLDE